MLAPKKTIAAWACARLAGIGVQSRARRPQHKPAISPKGPKRENVMEVGNDVICIV